MENNQTIAEFIYKFAIMLLFLLIPIGIMFLWQNNYTIQAPIDSARFGTFGDFVGGVLGSIWSLCGVLLFYSALKEQRNDSQINKKAFLKQVEAFEIQTQEFELQRLELRQSRQVFIEQSQTLMQQRLELTYFSLLGLYNKIISDLNAQVENESYFKQFKTDLLERAPNSGNPIDNYRIVKESYLEIFYNKKEELSHYFKLIYRIIKIIDDSEIKENEKFRYIKILRSQLSENEMLALYYNSHSDYGGELYKLVLKYNLLKHLPCISKIEFSTYLLTEKEGCENASEGNLVALNKKSSFLLRFNNEITKLLQHFVTTLTEEIIKEDFKKHKTSYLLPLCEDLTIAFYSMDYSELTI